ncbi:calmodulin-A-like [Symsagittifera roscoffensis]|uniref:calmodulin-A-like n=1 Tax=Symsagittifera roscoffensis TaxID=84072 RepID=UPI00307B3340
MTRFTPDQIAEYKECFDMFVQDDEDAIDEVGLGKVMETLGTPMSEEEIKEFILEVDLDGNGTIEFDEFLVMLERKMPEDEEGDQDDISIAFKVFDMMGDGLITKAAFRHVLRNLGEEIDEDDIDRIVDDADHDKDGKLNFHEFKKLFSDM